MHHIYRSCFILLCILYASMPCRSQTFELEEYELSENGNILQNPFAGGLNAPRFQEIDLNRDGQKDLIVFDREGSVVLPFIHSGQGGAAGWIYRPSYAAQFPRLVEWVKIRDADGDGVEDLFTGSSLGVPGIQLYRGQLEGDSLYFQLVELNQDFFNVLAYRVGNELANVDVTSIDIPGIADVDFDGDMDVFSFRRGAGAVHYYRNMQVEEDLPLDQIVFELEEHCWGDFYENDQTSEIDLGPAPGVCADNADGGSSRHHSGSTLQMIDPNRDSLIDVLIGDLTSSGVVFLLNDGTVEDAYMSRKDAIFPFYDQSVDLPAFLAGWQVDADKDGKADLVFSPNLPIAGSASRENAHLYLNTGSTADSFRFQMTDFIVGEMVDLGSKSVPAVTDLNGDGLPDLLIGREIDLSLEPDPTSALSAWINTGSLAAPVFELSEEDFAGFSVYASQSRAFAPVFADMDSDGDQDLIVGDQEGRLFYAENVAGAGAPVVIGTVTYQWMDIDVGQYAVPAVADLNGDGLKDLIIGERNGNNVDGMACGNLNYFENTGSPEEPQFSANPQNPCLGGISTIDSNQFLGYSAPDIYEGENSSIFITGTYLGELRQYAPGIPDSTFVLLNNNMGNIRAGSRSACRLANLDSDPRLELICGNQRGGLAIFETDFLEDGTSPVDDHYSAHLSIHLFPNPKSREETLYLQSEESLEAQYAVFDLQGRLVHSGTHSGVETAIKRDFKPGIYFISFKCDKCHIVKKFIVR